MNNEERIKDLLTPNSIVKHFKRELNDVSQNPLIYTYKIIAVAKYSEDKSKSFVIYQALYDPIKYQIFARPYEMFISEVDRDKYPNIKQKYRFEKL